MPAKRLAAREYWQLWVEKLSAAAKLQGEASCSNQDLEKLQSTADFLHSFPIEGIPQVVVQKFCVTRAVYLVGETLHVHTQRLRKKDELNAILLATHFGVVTEVRIHNFHTYRYFATTNVHVRITQSYWRVVQAILPYINRGPWIEVRRRRERTVRITFDDFLRPAVAAWKEGQPYAHIVCKIPVSEVNLITTRTKIPSKHPSLSVFSRGYTSDPDSDREVDIETEDYEQEHHEILLFLGSPSAPISSLVCDGLYQN